MYGADTAIQFLKEFHFSGTATTPIRSFFNSLIEYLYHRDVLAPPVFSNNDDSVPLVIPPTHNSFHAGASLSAHFVHNLTTSSPRKNEMEPENCARFVMESHREINRKPHRP
ncbi:conserved hypothetical protein [Trichinella spiralis]|uniref:hypothetical protein n=1 Tax=Trichinella spiralis TaxID=6334 RepID=UPI0001EFD623|nr:conserved hypothetical protein [Trichinella spiralis]